MFVSTYFEYGSKGSLKCIWLVFVKFYLTKVALVVIETVSKSETKLTQHSLLTSSKLLTLYCTT